MTLSIIGLTLAYLLLAFILLMVLLKSDLGAGVKFALIILAFGFYWLHFNSLVAYRGWPAEDQLPDRFELISFIVEEPDSKSGSGGEIYLWLRNLGDENSQPRAHRLRYRKQLHIQLDEVIDKQNQGQKLIGIAHQQKGSASGQGIEFNTPPKNKSFEKSETAGE